MTRLFRTIAFITIQITTRVSWRLSISAPLVSASVGSTYAVANLTGSLSVNRMLFYALYMFLKFDGVAHLLRNFSFKCSNLK